MAEILTAPHLLFSSTLNAECELEVDFKLEAIQQLIRNGNRLAQGFFALAPDFQRDSARRIACRLHHDNVSHIKETAFRLSPSAATRNTLRRVPDPDLVERFVEEEWRCASSTLEDRLETFASHSEIKSASPDEAVKTCCMASRDMQCELVLMFAMAQWGRVLIDFPEFRRLFQQSIEVLTDGLTSMRSASLSSQSRRYLDNMQIRLNYLRRLYMLFEQDNAGGESKPRCRDELTHVLEEFQASAARAFQEHN